MPRTLPWLTESAAKRNPSSPSSAQRKSRHREPSPSSDLDLVSADLDVLKPLVSTPYRSRKLPTYDPPSSPPALLPQPEVEYMRDGLGADDIFVMVEDEFDSTARLFTQHIHNAEYVRLRKLHRSRGEETLASVARPTDDNTKQSREVHMSLEKKELERKRREAGPRLENGESDEDDVMRDPQLAGLVMRSRATDPGRRLTGFAKAKSHTRAAAGYTQSPQKSLVWRDVLAEETGRRTKTHAPSTEEEDEETDDESDLDARPALKRPTVNLSASRTSVQEEDFFKRFAKPTEAASEPVEDSPILSKRHIHSPIRSPELRRTNLVAPGSASTPSRGGKGSRSAQILARRSEVPERHVAEPYQKPSQRKAKVHIDEEPVSVPKTSGTSSLTGAGSTDNAAHFLAKLQTKGEVDRKRQKLDDIPTFLF